MTTDLLLRPVGRGTMRRTANFGIELECLRPGSSDVRNYTRVFNTTGVVEAANVGHLHYYHCHCETCTYDRESPTMVAQQDGTVGVEFVSRILNADRDTDEVERIVTAHEAAMQFTGWRPNGQTSNGNHIHVSKSGMDAGSRHYTDVTIRQAQGLVESLFAVGEWGLVARGGCPTHRGYNGQKPQKEGRHEVYNPDADSGRGRYEMRSLKASDYRGTSWLANKPHTLEYRLWNTPSKASRIKAHVGLSLALTRWAFTQVIHDRGALQAMEMPEFMELAATRMADIQTELVLATPEAFRLDAAEALADWVLTTEPHTIVTADDIYDDDDDWDGDHSYCGTCYGCVDCGECSCGF